MHRYAIQHGHKAHGHQGAVAVSVLLAALMGQRAAKSGKFMPAGLVASVAAINFIANVHALQGSK